MLKRKKILLFLALGLPAAVIVRLLWPAEPACQGHRLSYWLRMSSPSTYPWQPGENARNRSQERRIEANNMVRAIGPTAFPYLAEWVAYEPTPAKTAFIAYMSKFRGGRFDRWLPESFTTDQAARRQKAAYEWFCLLGSSAQSATPELLRHLNQIKHPLAAQYIVRTLVSIGPEGELALNGFLTNSQPHPNSDAAKEALFTAARILPSSGSSAAATIPGLIRCLADENESHVITAAGILGDIRLHPELTLPALSNAVYHANPEVRRAALDAILKLDAGHPIAVFALSLALRDADKDVRKAATNALDILAPEVISKVAGGPEGNSSR